MRELNGCAVAEKSLDRRNAVPVIHVQGSSYDVGFDVGRVFSSMIKGFVGSYDNLRQFEKEYKTEAGRAAYDKTLANMKKRFPFYVKEIQGIADGSGVPFEKLFLLQMDDIIETINDNMIPRNDTGGCTSLAFHTKEKNTLLGHTEDAFSETLNNFYIMSAHITPTPEEKAAGAKEERFASLCYAGQLPGYTSGYNENGLTFSINTLSPRFLKPGGTPRTFLTRAILASKNFDDAERILTDEGLGAGNGFSINMIWTTPSGRQIYNVEVAPDLKADKSKINVRKYDEKPLVHVNIYQRLQVKEVIGPIIDSSEVRTSIINTHPIPKTRQDLANILSDTSGEDFQIFQQKPDSVIKTITAGIFDLDKMTWSLYIQKPNASEPVAVLPIRFKEIDDSK